MPFLLLLAGMVLVLGGVLWLRLHPFLALVIAALAVAVLTPDGLLEAHAGAQVEAGKLSGREGDELASASAPERVAGAFGKTCGQIGIIIAMAAVIGECMLASGAAHQIVAAVLKVFGAARASLAFLVSGFGLAIPVFFDTVFYLLMPIGRALYQKTGRDYLLYVMCIVAGGTMAHSLVPPTPGPLFVAGELDVPLWMMVVVGGSVGVVCVAAGFLLALRANRLHPVTPRDPEGGPGAPEKPANLPPLGLALLPVALPVALITLGTFADAHPVIAFISNKNIALVASAIVALVLVATAPGASRERVGKVTSSALASGATVILITAAGGAFGGVLRQTGIDMAVRDLAGGAHLAALPLVFLVTAVVRTAQGSATVAMITAAPVAVAFAGAGGLAFHPVYLAVAIGCGSKPIPWMNDSGFWVITKMAGLREAETLKTVTPMMSLMGVVGLLVCLLGAWLVPLV